MNLCYSGMLEQLSLLLSEHCHLLVAVTAFLCKLVSWVSEYYSDLALNKICFWHFIMMSESTKRRWNSGPSTPSSTLKKKKKKYNCKFQTNGKNHTNGILHSMMSPARETQSMWEIRLLCWLQTYQFFLFSPILNRETEDTSVIVLGLTWSLHNIILYHCSGQFYWWREPDYP
jgi:hypothetical protein